MTLKRMLYLEHGGNLRIAEQLPGFHSGASANRRRTPVKKNEIKVVSSAARMAPEAGVWVIAETHDTPTSFSAKMVVTDDQGRYLVLRICSPQASL